MKNDSAILPLAQAEALAQSFPPFGVFVTPTSIPIL